MAEFKSNFRHYENACLSTCAMHSKKKKLFPADIFGQTQFFFTTKVLITFYKNNITTALATRLTVKMRVQMYRF